MDTAHSVLNDLFVKAFSEITKIEERSVKLATGDDLSVTEMHTLEAIGTGQPNMMSEVAALLRITVSTLTISVNRLVNKGYVERYRAEEDRRVVKVVLTEKAKPVLEAHRRFHGRMIDAVVETLETQEVEIFTGSIRRLLDFFKNENERISNSMKVDAPIISAKEEEEDLLNYKLVE